MVKSYKSLCIAMLMVGLFFTGCATAKKTGFLQNYDRMSKGKYLENYWSNSSFVGKKKNETIFVATINTDNISNQKGISAENCREWIKNIFSIATNNFLFETQSHRPQRRLEIAITEMTPGSAGGRLLAAELGLGHAIVQVEGRVVDIDSNEEIVVFSDRRRSSGSIGLRDIGGDSGPTLVREMIEQLSIDIMNELNETFAFSKEVYTLQQIDRVDKVVSAPQRSTTKPKKEVPRQPVPKKYAHFILDSKQNIPNKFPEDISNGLWLSSVPLNMDVFVFPEGKSGQNDFIHQTLGEGEDSLYYLGKTPIHVTLRKGKYSIAFIDRNLYFNIIDPVEMKSIITNYPACVWAHLGTLYCGVKHTYETQSNLTSMIAIILKEKQEIPKVLQGLPDGVNFNCDDMMPILEDLAIYFDPPGLRLFESEISEAQEMLQRGGAWGKILNKDYKVTFEVKQNQKNVVTWSRSSDQAQEPQLSERIITDAKNIDLNVDLWRKSAYKRIVDNYNKAIENNSRDAKAYVNRAQIYDKKGEYDLAIKDCENAIKINSNYAEAYFIKAIVYEDKGKDDFAMQEFSKAIEINPNEGRFLCNRGRLYCKKGEYELALRDFNKAIEINPSDAFPYHNRGMVYDKKGEYKLALQDSEKAIEINPEFAEFYNSRGNILKHKGEYDLAIDDFKKAISIKPENDMFYANRGKSYEKSGSYELAVQDYTKSIEINPRVPWLYGSRGYLYFKKLGDKEKGCFDWKRACELGDCKNYNDFKSSGSCD